MTMNLSITSKYFNQPSKKQESKDMWKYKNFAKPNIKTILNSFNGSRDTTILTVEIEAKTITQGKDEAIVLLTSVLLIKVSSPNHITVAAKLWQKLKFQ